MWFRLLHMSDDSVSKVYEAPAPRGKIHASADTGHVIITRTFEDIDHIEQVGLRVSDLEAILAVIKDAGK